ncbi:MAG: glycyl-radical enzyme activating protein [Bacteroidetes bacterium]|nr:glycyl-radical enzyme activating protein [Bacteroidota bacterium]
MGQTKLARGHIFDIQGFSLHDGPGCRSLIFFKGCTLECAWCSNPEGISFAPEPLYLDSKCTLDGLCVDACSHGAITCSPGGAYGRLTFDREICARCSTYSCAKVCCSGAVRIGGYEISIEELYATINRDRQFWGAGGGITLTGGEPFAQPEFAHDLLKRCFDAYIHTAVETCGNVRWENYEKSLPYIDWIFFDLKTMNGSEKLQTDGLPADPTGPPFPGFTRSSISQILSNASRIANEFPGHMVFRLPLIPGFNDDAGNIHETARFIRSTGRNEVNVLPLHHLGREKYRLTGKTYYTGDFKIPGKDHLDEIASQFTSYGIHCYIGSETPF